MKTLAIQVPDEIDLALGCPQTSVLEYLLRIPLAVKLFESGRTTSGQSASIAGLSRKAFLLELPKHGMPSVLSDKEESLAEDREYLAPTTADQLRTRYKSLSTSIDSLASKLRSTAT